MLTRACPLRFGVSRKWLAGLLSASGLLAFGCAGWDQPPPSATMSEESRAMSSMREAGPEGEMLGLDARARQIERNLGFR